LPFAFLLFEFGYANNNNGIKKDVTDSEKLNELEVPDDSDELDELDDSDESDESVI